MFSALKASVSSGETDATAKYIENQRESNLELIICIIFV